MTLLRSFATVGGYTLASRVLGFVRDMLIAATLGTGPVADAFFVAFRFPNLFRRLFAEGAFNSAFVPLFAKRLAGEGEASARAFAEHVLAGLTAVLLILSALAMIAMPWLMVVLAPGFSAEPDKYDLAVLLTRITFPYLLCMSLVALFSGILNARGKFAAAAAAPVLLNIVLIGVLLALVWLGERATALSGTALAWGVTGAGLAQLAMIVQAARRDGMGLKLVRPRWNDGVKRLVRLGLPGLFAGGITQLNIVVGTIIASLQAGAVSYLYYADRVYQLPLGVIGIAVGVVLLPDLSRRLRAGQMDHVRHSQNRALEFSMLLTLPAAAALIAVPGPIVQVLFERGAFDSADIAPTRQALAAFAAGLPAFVLIKVFSPGFFAREDTKTPMWFAALSVVVNIVASLLLYLPLGHVGIAIATSLAGVVNAGLLGVTLYRRGHLELDDIVRTRLPRIVLCALLMGLALWLAALPLAPYFSAATLVPRIAALALLIGLGFGVFALAAHLSSAADLDQLRRMLRRGS